MEPPSTPLLTGLAHINLNVPTRESLIPAADFWVQTLGLVEIPVPQLQRETLKWFQLPTGQQIHVSLASSTTPPDPHFSLRSNHPCFHVPTPEALLTLQTRIWEHFSGRTDLGARPSEADEPGGVDSGAKGVEYPSRFFCRDWVGNRLEFSL